MNDSSNIRFWRDGHQHESPRTKSIVQHRPHAAEHSRTIGSRDQQRQDKHPDGRNPHVVTNMFNTHH